MPPVTRSRGARDDLAPGCPIRLHEGNDRIRVRHVGRRYGCLTAARTERRRQEHPAQAPLGVEQPTAGSVCVDGHDLWREEVAARAALAYVPEHPDLTPYATVGEVLGLVCRLRGRPVDDGVLALEAVGLGDLGDRSVRELSMGQRRRAVLAAAFIGEPTTLLLDEPLEAMDRAMRLWLTSWISDASARDATIVIATHDVEPFVHMARRAIVVAQGAARVVYP